MVSRVFIGNLILSSYGIQFNIDYEKWLSYFLLVNKPNITQSWHYGDAKVKSQGWKIIRGIITENDKPIALIQALYRKFLFVKFVRVSYGPLWIIEAPSLAQIKGVFHVIIKNWNVRKRSVLSIAPNLESSQENNKILSELHFFKRKCVAYQSGLVDLTQSIEDLRARLRQNWRNQLNSSEKKKLSFHVSQIDSDFRWLIASFEVFRREKNFYGHSIALLKALHDGATDLHEVFVTFVSQGGDRVAGMLIVNSGLFCVPLVIWTNKNGRTLNAGNFLLWNSVLCAKDKGYLWFDLGSTSGAKFKAGLPHIPYQMIGEYCGFV